MTETGSKAAAQGLVEAHKHRSAALEQVLSVWQLSRSDAARIFGVSRQTVGRWLNHGVPPARAVAVGDLAAATEILTRHLKRERIPSVVRRPAAALDNRSLLAMLEQRSYRSVMENCRRMFEFGQANRR